MRHAKGGYVYHVLNRAVGRATLFAKATNYEAFVRVLAEALDWVDIRLLAYCVMPNHWHLVVWPERDGDLSEFMRWLTVTHTQRWHAKHHGMLIKATCLSWGLSIFPGAVARLRWGWHSFRCGRRGRC
jgi:REP element-mobilizing transposase RayT